MYNCRLDIRRRTASSRGEWARGGAASRAPPPRTRSAHTGGALCRARRPTTPNAYSATKQFIRCTIHPHKHKVGASTVGKCTAGFSVLPVAVLVFNVPRQWRAGGKRGVAVRAEVRTRAGVRVRVSGERLSRRKRRLAALAIAYKWSIVLRNINLFNKCVQKLNQMEMD